MNSKINCYLSSLLLASVVPATAQLTYVTTFSANNGNTGAGEIISFDSSTKRVFATQSSGLSHGVNWFDFSNPAAPTAGGFVDFSNLYGNGASGIASLTSVAIDPMGRGFGVAAVVPTLNADYSTLGRIGIFDTSTGAILNTLDIGYHPDSVSFTPDGSRILIANEGEYVDIPSQVNRPGGISVVDLAGVTSLNKGTTLAGLTQSSVTTRDFTGVDISSARYNSLPGATNGAVESAINNIEPEYITSIGGKAYASLQEANAIGVYDLNTNQWTNVFSMGTRAMNNVDLTRRNGINLEATTPFVGLPMPDTIASFQHGGKTYIVTANEGDARGADDADVMRVSAARTAGLFAPGVEIDTKYNNLNISIIDGLDENGKIVVPHVYGGRGFSVIDAETGQVVYDSLNSTGTNFESIISQLDPGVWPAPINLDDRSDDKGPEPEALTIGEIDGVMYLFVGMERSDNILMFSLADPTNPQFVQLVRVGSSEAPESMAFLDKDLSGLDQDYLLVSYEDTNDIQVFSVIPEPSTYAAIAAGLLGLWAVIRRRR